jgi:O-acetyl-ADP-ribose deacetylase (regulator of RNase III)
MKKVLKSGNIFNSNADAIVVTVNCMGFMGKGMALECSLRLPEIEKLYRNLCDDREVKIGEINWIRLKGLPAIALFPTKGDFKLPSKISYIKDGLNTLAADLATGEYSSIAIPHLGSDLGKLDWPAVEKEVEEALGNFSGEVEIWEFDETKEDRQLIEIKDRLDGGYVPTGLRPEDIDVIKYRLEKSIPGSAASLLSLPGIGKGKVRSLFEAPEKDLQAMLF